MNFRRRSLRRDSALSHHRWTMPRATVALLGASLAIAACSDNDGGSGSTDGFVSESYMHERSLDYLRYATAGFSPSDSLNIIAHLERERIDPPYRAPRGAVPTDTFDASFVFMDTLQDTRDFRALYMLNLLLGYGGHEVLPATLWQGIEDALARFKYWYTHPTPEGLRDDSYYWTENHQAIYWTIQYLMGQEFPDRPLSTDGRPGREHLEEARASLMRWFEHRARWGFFEWHSNVYYQKDLTPLLTLVEYADDEEIRTKAASILDILLFDMALHTHRGAFGTTHGRSYKKDKMTSLDDDTWNGVKLLFDESTYDYQSRGAPDAVLLARAQHYRMPEAILRVAKSKEPITDRERMSLPINEKGPVVLNPEAPFGLTFGEEDLDVWWGMSGLLLWQVVPTTVEVFNRYNLWETALFRDFAADLQPLSGNIPVAQSLAASRSNLLAFATLKEVNTYTHRTRDYMLSSALDYRKGAFASQVHAWQATLDANAVVFTTHPFRPPLQSTVWRDDEETGSYWTGEASMPRSAQHENVGVHIYVPQYAASNPAPFTFFRYQNYTHAYFPQDHFDEVVQVPATPEGTWTLGKLGSGYVALYSYRPVEWIVYDPTVIATNGMLKPFDLRANGGPNNVWVVECGSEAEWGSFAAFRDAIADARVDVTPKGPLTAVSTQFDVAYQSPSQGLVEFGWERPFAVAGAEVPQSDFLRFDNPFSQTEYNTQQTTIEADGFRIELDLEAGTRQILAP